MASIHIFTQIPIHKPCFAKNGKQIFIPQNNLPRCLGGDLGTTAQGVPECHGWWYNI